MAERRAWQLLGPFAFCRVSHALAPFLLEDFQVRSAVIFRS